MANRNHVRIRKRVLQTERMVGRTNDQNAVVKAGECPEVGRSWFVIQKAHLQASTEPFFKIRNWGFGRSGGHTVCFQALPLCCLPSGTADLREQSFGYESSSSRLASASFFLFVEIWLVIWI